MANCAAQTHTPIRLGQQFHGRTATIVAIWSKYGGESSASSTKATTKAPTKATPIIEPIEGSIGTIGVAALSQRIDGIINHTKHANHTKHTVIVPAGAVTNITEQFEPDVEQMVGGGPHHECYASC